MCDFNPAERKIHFRENWLICWGIWGEAELILVIWGAKAKIISGRLRFFQGLGEINAREQRAPLEPQH